MKACSVCKQEKPLADFWPDRRRKNGHMARCKACNTLQAKKYRQAHPEHGLKRYWSNPQGERERHLVRKYGVTQADYDQMYAAQGGACAICRKTQKRAFDADHDHATGRVRGLLCTSCNRMIGHAGDNAGCLRAAADYLEVVPQVAAQFIGAFLDLRRAA